MPTVYRPKGSKTYRFKAFDRHGIRVDKKGTRKKNETHDVGTDFENREALIRKGLLDPQTVDGAANSHRSFLETYKEYIQHGKTQGGRGNRPWSTTHLRNREAHGKFWEKELGLQSLSDIRLENVEKVGQKMLLGDPDNKAKKLTPKSVNNRYESIAAFCKWCKDRGYLAFDPLEKLGFLEASPKEITRALTPEEIEKLLAVARPEMRLLYMVALCTGYRAGELGALKVKDLDTINHTLPLAAEYTKARKDARQPIPVWLTIELQARVTFKKQDEPLLNVPSHPARELDKDLVKADIKKRSPDILGKLCFHSLRHTFVTLAVQVGADVKTAQQLARHSTPSLTMNVYAHTENKRLVSTVDSIGEFMKPVRVQCRANVDFQATGTDGIPVTTDSKHVTELNTDGGGGNRTRVPRRVK